MTHMEGINFTSSKQELSDIIHAAITQIAATTRDYLLAVQLRKLAFTTDPFQGRYLKRLVYLVPVEEMLDVVMDGNGIRFQPAQCIDMRYEEALMPISQKWKIQNNAISITLAMHSGNMATVLTGSTPKRNGSPLSEDEWQRHTKIKYIPFAR